MYSVTPPATHYVLTSIVDASHTRQADPDSSAAMTPARVTCRGAPASREKATAIAALTTIVTTVAAMMLRTMSPVDQPTANPAVRPMNAAGYPNAAARGITRSAARIHGWLPESRTLVMPPKLLPAELDPEHRSARARGPVAVALLR